MDYEVACCEMKGNERLINLTNHIKPNGGGTLWIWAEEVKSEDNVTKLEDSLVEEACFRKD